MNTIHDFIYRVEHPLSDGFWRPTWWWPFKEVLMTGWTPEMINHQDIVYDAFRGFHARRSRA